MNDPPRLLITMGDVAGVGPEIIARAWPDLLALGRPVVVGDPDWLARGLKLVGAGAAVEGGTNPNDARPTPERVPCLAATQQDLRALRHGAGTASAGPV